MSIVSRLHQVCSCLLTALGAVHTLLTPVIVGEFSLDAMWFAGSGLTMIFVGFLNITLRRDVGRDKVVRVLCYLANIICTAFGALIVIVDREPQVIFGLLMLITITLTSSKVNR